MGIREEAEPVILTIGGEIFGEPQLAENALEDFDFWYKDGDRPSVVAWKTFVYYMELDNALEEALNRALAVPDLRKYLLKRLREEDAEDIAQRAKIKAHKYFHNFKPYYPNSWHGWQYMIAKRLAIDFFRVWKVDRVFDLTDATELLPEHEFAYFPEGYDPRGDGWAIPVVCEEWMESDNPRKAQFAAQLLLMYHNLAGWNPLYGNRMQEIVGASPSTLHFWFSEFSQEVIRRERK